MNDDDWYKKAEAIKLKSDGARKIVDSLIFELQSTNPPPNWPHILEQHSSIFQHLSDLGQVCFWKFEFLFFLKNDYFVIDLFFSFELN